MPTLTRNRHQNKASTCQFQRHFDESFRGVSHSTSTCPKPSRPKSCSPISVTRAARIRPGSQMFLPPPKSSIDECTGALLSNIKLLKQRGRFPTGKRKTSLVSTDNVIHFVNFRVEMCRTSKEITNKRDERADVFLACFVDEEDKEPETEIPLTGASLVSRTYSGHGPCLYLTTVTGVFEFQCCPGEQSDYPKWESLLIYLGVSIVFPHDLFFANTSDIVGEGMFAQVFNATHKATGKEVVIKKVPKDKLGNLASNMPSAVDIEIDVLRRLYHPYIVQFQTAFEDDSHYFIVLESLHGGNVYEWLRKYRTYTESQARGAMFRLLKALISLETTQVVHRDIKLENLVLEDPTDPSSIKLIDFGLAAFIKSERIHMTCGSPGFVAPEIIAKAPYGCRADMFSTGVFLYSILSGKFPFHSDGDTASTTLWRNEQCNVNFDSYACRKISPAAKDLVLRMLTRSPSARLSPEQALMHPWMLGYSEKPLPRIIPCRIFANTDDVDDQNIAQFNAAVTRLPLVGGPSNPYVEGLDITREFQESCSVMARPLEDHISSSDENGNTTLEIEDQYCDKINNQMYHYCSSNSTAVSTTSSLDISECELVNGCHSQFCRVKKESTAADLLFKTSVLTIRANNSHCTAK